MSNVAARKMGASGSSRTAQAELKVISNKAKALRNDPEALRRTLKQAGILTPSGKLSKAFGG
jgi:hypothetical protein